MTDTLPADASEVALLEVCSLGGHTMGTRWSARVCVRRGRELRGLHEGIARTLDSVVAQMSTWEADSDICRYNRAAPGSATRLPEAFRQVVQVALEVAQASGGAFDPTVGPLVELWGFGATGGVQRVPDADSLAAAAARVGWQRLQWQEADCLLQPGGLHLDLSGIAKGYGVDAVAAYLRQAGVANALVEIGGELYAQGRKPDGQAWRVLVESGPEEDSADLPPRVLALDGLAVATSGDRWHRFEAEGARYSHSFDPRLGRPVPEAAAAVTVLAADATQADAWATAMTVLGEDEGLRLAEATGLAVRFLTRHQGGLRERYSATFERHLDEVA